MREVKIDTEYITLGQFLKLADLIQSGGMAKWFLDEFEVFVNEEPEQRRGKKLKPNDRVLIEKQGSYIITSS